MIRIAIAGKGGVGKTLVAAGLAQAFAGSGQRTLAIDADPSPNLALMLGLSVAESEAIVPLSANEDLVRAKTATRFPGVYNLSFTVDDIVRDFTVPTPAGVHLLVMGTIQRMGAGCSCPANTLLRNVLHRLVTGEDEVIILDMEAGVEHLGRGTAENVDLFLIITTADSRALATAGSVARIATEAKIPRVMLAGNRIRNAREEEIIRDFGRERNIPVLGLIPYDARVSEGGIAGESVQQLKDSAALNAIRKMVEIITGRSNQGKKAGHGSGSR